MSAYDYDILVIGAGQGGLPAAHMAANLGANIWGGRTSPAQRERGHATQPVQPASPGRAG
jgi:succinate dehydrogenase/fumarate reductase flavoprotein subunit